MSIRISLNDDNAVPKDISPFLFPRKQTFQDTNFVSANGPVITANARNITKRKMSDQEECGEVLRCARSLRHVSAINPPRHLPINFLAVWILLQDNSVWFVLRFSVSFLDTGSSVGEKEGEDANDMTANLREKVHPPKRLLPCGSGIAAPGKPIYLLLKADVHRKWVLRSQYNYDFGRREHGTHSGCLPFAPAVWQILSVFHDISMDAWKAGILFDAEITFVSTLRNTQIYPHLNAQMRRRRPRRHRRSPNRYPAPERWRDIYDAINAMRSDIVAPVDSMGYSAPLKEKEPQPTKDKITGAVVKRLRAVLGGSISVQSIIYAEDSSIAAIAEVGFWRRKTQQQYDSEMSSIQTSRKPFMNYALYREPPTKNPEETRLNLRSWLPTELHQEINHLLIGFGQVHQKWNDVFDEQVLLASKQFKEYPVAITRSHQGPNESRLNRNREYPKEGLSIVKESPWVMKGSIPELIPPPHQYERRASLARWKRVSPGLKGCVAVLRISGHGFEACTAWNIIAKPGTIGPKAAKMVVEPSCRHEIYVLRPLEGDVPGICFLGLETNLWLPRTTLERPNAFWYLEVHAQVRRRRLVNLTLLWPGLLTLKLTWIKAAYALCTRFHVITLLLSGMNIVGNDWWRQFRVCGKDLVSMLVTAD
ncbi:hypothetical protein EDD85DRAFT_795274 [Armillaria nabsnona]|nr:hypothetical protein EDD85DRAFT_795274 [Armillaria nabsnona]